MGGKKVFKYLVIIEKTDGNFLICLSKSLLDEKSKLKVSPRQFINIKQKIPFW